MRRRNEDWCLGWSSLQHSAGNVRASPLYYPQPRLAPNWRLAHPTLVLFIETDWPCKPLLLGLRYLLSKASMNGKRTLVHHHHPPKSESASSQLPWQRSSGTLRSHRDRTRSVTSMASLSFRLRHRQSPRVSAQSWSHITADEWVPRSRWLYLRILCTQHSSTISGQLRPLYLQMWRRSAHIYNLSRTGWAFLDTM